MSTNASWFGLVRVRLPEACPKSFVSGTQKISAESLVVKRDTPSLLFIERQHFPLLSGQPDLSTNGMKYRGTTVKDGGQPIRDLQYG